MNVLPLLISALASPALYIDPNTGGMLFQMLAVFFALFSGILFFFSRQIKTFFARFRRITRKEDEPHDSDSPPDQTAPK